MADMFSAVELEVGSRCNRRCSYCPVATNPRPAVPVKMPERVFQRVVDQLVQVRFSGRLSYHFYNEPLLRKDLDRLVSVVHERLPNVLQVLYTNGDLLDDDRYERLRTAGIDYFIVTLHSGGEFPSRSFQIVQRSEQLVLTNRGGVLTHLPLPLRATLVTPCHAPGELLMVSVTGDVLLCYEDANRHHVMGNVTDMSIREIWTSRRFTELRRSLADGRREILPMCASCSNTAHCRPGMSVIDEPFLNSPEPLPADLAELKRLSNEARARGGTD